MSDSRITPCPACGVKNRVPVASKGRPQCASCKAPLPWLVDASDANLAQALDTSTLVLLDLWAPWCGPCRMVAPILESLAATFAGQIKVVKVNVDDNPIAAQRFNARSIPLLVMLRKGNVVDTVVGAQPEPALKTRIQQLLSAP